MNLVPLIDGTLAGGHGGDIEVSQWYKSEQPAMVSNNEPVLDFFAVDAHLYLYRNEVEFVVAAFQQRLRELDGEPDPDLGR